MTNDAGTTESVRTVWQEVRAEMGRKRVSGTQLATLCGIPQSTLARRLNGEVEFRVDELKAVAEALGVNWSQFVLGEDGEQQQ